MNGNPSILVVDDDPETLRYVSGTLVDAGYAPVVTRDPDDVSPLLRRHRPGLAVLDLAGPGSDGIEVMQYVLATAGVPVLLLSARGQEEIIARALDTGAADYVVRPFSSAELSVRIAVALMRGPGGNPEEATRPYVRGHLAIDYAGRTVTVAGAAVRLTSTEYRMLAELSLNSGRAMTHGQLLRRVWSLGRESRDSGPVRTVIKRLRRKLGDDASEPAHIFTVPGVGYRMEKPDDGARP